VGFDHLFGTQGSQDSWGGGQNGMKQEVIGKFLKNFKEKQGLSLEKCERGRKPLGKSSHKVLSTEEKA